MTDLDFYDDFDDFEGFDDGEYWDLEDDDWDDEADDLTPAGLIAGGVGAALGGTLGTGVYDAGTWALKKAAEKTGATKYKPVKWAYDNAWNPKSKFGSYVRNAYGNLGAGLLGTAGAALFEDSDPFEPEYTAEDIDLMEALAEEAVEAEGEDSVIAGDEMVARSFGVMRASPRIRPIIQALRAKVRRILAMAKRDPRYRVMARLAPLALRRTAATLMRMAAARRPVNTRMANMLFGRILASLMRAPNRRAQAVRQSQLRARRHRARRGLPAPTRVKRPVYARPRTRSGHALPRPAYA